MLSTGIDKETGNPVTGYIVKEASSERVFIIPENGLKIIDGKPVIQKIREIEVMSEKTFTPFLDTTGYPICVGDTLEIKSRKIGKVQLLHDAIVFVTDCTMDGDETYTFISPHWIISNGAQVTRDEYSGYIKPYQAGYAREFI